MLKIEFHNANQSRSWNIDLECCFFWWGHCAQWNKGLNLFNLLRRWLGKLSTCCPFLSRDAAFLFKTWTYLWKEMRVMFACVSSSYFETEKELSSHWCRWGVPAENFYYDLLCSTVNIIILPDLNFWFVSVTHNKFSHLISKIPPSGCKIEMLYWNALSVKIQRFKNNKIFGTHCRYKLGTIFLIKYH